MLGHGRTGNADIEPGAHVLLEQEAVHEVVDGFLEGLPQAVVIDTGGVDEAVEILLAAQAEHWAPISHHGVLHDRASYRHHWYVLERAWLTGQPLPAEIEERFFLAVRDQ